MNKFVVYGILLLSYLALSKSFSPNEFGIKYVKTNEDLVTLVPGAPVTMILTDIHSTGFLIKTYYHKYKIVYGFQSYEELIVRTSKNFSQKSLPYLGMSIFRRFKNNSVDFTPLPPGSIYIGNKNFGNWVYKGRGDKKWKFFRVYRQFPQYLGWNNFSPTYTTYELIRENLKKQKPFLGSNDEFGINGSITKVAFPNYFTRKIPKQIDFKSVFENYLRNNFK